MRFDHLHFTLGAVGILKPSHRTETSTPICLSGTVNYNFHIHNFSQK
uniref:Uncharacterized protein n=1 Tax=Anguilla anguilla TaxID=7936 RepID=A0A0E9TFM5_ANGAN